MKAKIYVTLKPAILDPQGQAVQKTLGRMGFEEVKEVRVRQSTSKSTSATAIKRRPRRGSKRCARSSSATPSSRSIGSRSGSAFTFAVIRFPGSNCDDDALFVVDRLLKGASGRMVWHKDQDIGKVDAVVIPGGFSYGDYLRAGAMAAHSPIMESVKAFAHGAGRCSASATAFRILCESGLLEGRWSKIRV